MKYIKIDADTVKEMESIINNGQRVELIPVKDGVKVVRIRRETVHDPQKKE